MRMHESAREEVGWLMTLVGVVALVLGVIDLWLAGQGANVLTAAWAWAMLLIGVAVALVGLWLHLTRPRRRSGADTPETSSDSSPVERQRYETEPAGQSPETQMKQDQETTP